MARILLLLFLLLLVPAPSKAQDRVVPQSAAQMQLSFAPVAAKVAPAVVNVYSRRTVREPRSPFFNDPFFSRFFGQGPMAPRVQQSLGSGVIVRADGVILTNNHVISGGDDIKIALADRREFEAQVVLADDRTDLAVLRIDTRGEKLPALGFADSDRAQVGDLVLAIGNPFGVGQTVTSGIVSALSRTAVGVSDYQFFIQTDAAINPGNSGGALVDMSGRLLGVNTAIYSRTGGSIGIGFAVPANLARLVVEGALGGGIKRPWFGADGQPVTPEIAQSLGLARPEGVLLKSIYPGGPAGEAGLKIGDVVLALGTFEVLDPQALRYRVATMKPGDDVAVRVFRNGKEHHVTLHAVLPPETPPRRETTIGGETPLQGAKVANLSPAVAEELRLDPFTKGVVVIAIKPRSYAARYGFRPGDIVKRINGEEIASVSGLNDVLAGDARGWRVSVERYGSTLNLSVR